MDLFLGGGQADGRVAVDFMGSNPFFVQEMFVHLPRTALDAYLGKGYSITS